MPTEVITAVISGVVGLLTGSAVTAWAQWGIEKRRLKLQRRYDLMDSWRTGITKINPERAQTKILSTAWYETLRPYLSDDVRDELERPRTFIVPPDNGRGLKDMFTSEIDRVEREWGLRP